MKYEPLSIHSKESNTPSKLTPTISSYFNRLFTKLSLIIIESKNQLNDSFKSLESCPKELYVNFCLKFCESYNYFAISQILVLYLHQEFNCSDIEAGTIYGTWGLCITFWGILTSSINDILGVRRSLLIGFTISFFATFAIAFARSKTFLLVMLFGILPLGTSMGIPMLTVGK